MAERRFFDTNVLVYAHAADQPQKKRTARQLLTEHLGDQTAVFSTQVLQEYFVAATRLGLPAELAQQHVATYSQASVVQVTTELILAAIDLHRLHQISFWDALIVRSAGAAGCGVVLSEDMKHGQRYGGVRIENPFIRA
ncbi:MAG TPA: PIN domain-containing protein [Myxococcaceae bacterium]|nr:PIN domain-containing protein [Myxococcaceae bacterium]